MDLAEGVAVNDVRALEALIGTTVGDDLDAYRLRMVNRQIAVLRERSSFYQCLLAGYPLSLRSLDELAQLPFTTADDLRGQESAFCCVPASAVQRIVTLRSSGSSGAAKRLMFSAADLERTVAFFAAGMQCMTGPGERVMIFMPATQDGISDLLRRGLCRFGAVPYIYGPVTDMADAIRACSDFQPDCMVGLPSQMRQLSLLAPSIAPRTLLLSADYIAESLCDMIRRQWNCEIFRHWGMTETGYGGAVECPAHAGWHIRHDELLLEIIDPENGAILPPGQRGELVLTTLRREAMPLLRYRTGDIAALETGSCACGSRWPRLRGVYGRLTSAIPLPDGRQLSIHLLDELLFADRDVLDFTADLRANRLGISILTQDQTALARIQQQLSARFPDLDIAVNAGKGFASTGVAKRRIIQEDVRDESGQE